MAEYAVVRLSDLGDRMDASFHVALAKLRGRVVALRKDVTEEEAVARIAALPLAAKAPLLVLARGDRPVLTPVLADRLAVQYPHLSLALVHADLSRTVGALRERIARDTTDLDALLALGRDLPIADEAFPAPDKPPSPGM